MFFLSCIDIICKIKLQLALRFGVITKNIISVHCFYPCVIVSLNSSFFLFLNNSYKSAFYLTSEAPFKSMLQQHTGTLEQRGVTKA